MKEIEANKHAWGQIAEDHYHTFKKRLSEGCSGFNKYITQEIGDLSGKKIIHLQCNVGVDTILLARMTGSTGSVVGVDLVPDNIKYSRMLAEDFGIENVEFIESDVLQFMEKYSEKYDVVFTSEGAIGWLPGLGKWAKTVRHLLKDDGFFYVFDNHPFVMMFDERKLADNIMEVTHPYFSNEPDVDDYIGGYAAETKTGFVNYWWNHTVADIINSLASAGLRIEYFHEFQENYYDSGGLKSADGYLWNYDFNSGKFPMTFSLKATVCRM